MSGPVSVEFDDLRDRLTVALQPWTGRIVGFPLHDVITDVLGVLDGEIAAALRQRERIAVEPWARGLPSYQRPEHDDFLSRLRRVGVT